MTKLLRAQKVLTSPENALYLGTTTSGLHQRTCAVLADIFLPNFFPNLVPSH